MEMQQQEDLTDMQETSKIELHGDIREFDTSKLKRILQSLETGLFFCQIFVFII